jgi:flagellin-specific chaperone FliS
LVFLAGGAAGTIAKSISADDMQVSDAIYGSCRRYVCRERLEAMLDYEQRLNLFKNVLQLYGYLFDRRCIVQLTEINHAYLSIHSHEVLGKIGRDSSEWEAMVPAEVAAAIKQRKLFGYG